MRKAKSKTSEVRSDLTTVRVIKRNLVYVAGLPAKIADEEVNTCYQIVTQFCCTLTYSAFAFPTLRYFASHLILPVWSEQVIY